jgi:F-type H+-transporting ATPase subunit epsilon
MTLRFMLSTPDKTFFNGPADSLICPGPDGYFGILPRHAQMVAAVGLRAEPNCSWSMAGWLK